ncbi:MAG: response regulator [Alphaproteobacteria bacterium]|jgi:CheY-like chemotaxis protein|nr:response regulator [Alphaproteobacteria bacterium]
MAVYDLERMSVLLVDDSSFTRALLSRVLRSLNVLTITQASDGAEAINFLKSTVPGALSSPTGVQRYDLIIADWKMTPVDGAMLLKWVRRHKESPNRFMPFVMLSALSEMETVNEARNLGANEFLVKPFSIASISAKLTALIERPRNFVYTRDYFGPDRRRNQQPISFENRRVARKENIEIIHSGKIPGTFKEGVSAYYIAVPNQLKNLVAGLGGSAAEAGQFDESALAAASMELASMESDYSDWVLDSISKLQRAVEELKDQPKNYWKYYTLINNIAHDLRGQGETFGYPLITILGKSLFDYTRIQTPPDDKFIELIRSHIDSIQAVLREKIKGQGGEVGMVIVGTLEEAKRRYEAR